MKRILLCADDYAQNSAISQAIIALAEQSRLSAVSCLVTMPDWPEQAAWLTPFFNHLDIGLHFNLTEGKLFFHPTLSLPQLLLRSQCRLLKINAIEHELNAQLDHFEKTLGKLPDFIDGHQHVHQFPIVRDALLNIYEKRLRQHQVYLRCTQSDLVLRDVKNIIIQFAGARAFKKLLQQKNIPHNTSFTGTYSFSNSTHYSTMFPEFLQKISDGGLIMCHPGASQHPIENDAIAAARIDEYHYFMSNKFLEDCKQHDVVLTRFK